MNFYEYTSLSDHEQFHLLHTIGDFVDVKIVGSKRFVLYKLYDFFVELTYDTEKNITLDKVVFKNFRNGFGRSNGRK